MRASPPLRVAPFVALALCSGCASPSTVPVPSGVSALFDTTYYDIDGVRPREWMRSMMRIAPTAGVEGSFAARTTWSTHWAYAATRNAPAGCEAVRPTVDAAVHFIMPRLRSDSGVAPADRTEWARFTTSLWRHEEGHAQRGLHAAGAELETLRRLRTPSCQTFSMEAVNALGAVLHRYQLSDADYDRDTRHGVRQGANLIVDPTRPLAIDTTYRDSVR